MNGKPIRGPRTFSIPATPGTNQGKGRDLILLDAPTKVIILLSNLLKDKAVRASMAHLRQLDPTDSNLDSLPGWPFRGRRSPPHAALPPPKSRRSVDDVRGSDLSLSAPLSCSLPLSRTLSRVRLRNICYTLLWMS